ncbi:hypothetical protein B0H13DRAFT_1916052 [Mycena leptocephala]|nr:hypothetical protein B0H13DRAFT_1916052 [Mycena leptocephala]
MVELRRGGVEVDSAERDENEEETEGGVAEDVVGDGCHEGEKEGEQKESSRKTFLLKESLKKRVGEEISRRMSRKLSRSARRTTWNATNKTTSLLKCRNLDSKGEQFNWNKYRQLSKDIATCAKRVRSIRTAVLRIIEAEHQRKLAADIRETELIPAAAQCFHSCRTTREHLAFEFRINHIYSGA